MGKRGLEALAAAVAFLVLAVVGFAKEKEAGHVVINEICSNNFAAKSDGNGNYPDCVELYNPGEEPFLMDGCFLTDDKDEPEKFPLEGVVVPARGHAVVWLPKERGLRLSKEGDTLFLVDAVHGVFWDEAAIPPLSYDTTYGRIRDGTDGWSVMTPTLGNSNDGAGRLPAVLLEKPVFDTASGFYETEFLLRISSPQGKKIYYTLDGSEPTKDSLPYREPLLIADNTLQENRYAMRTDLAPTQAYAPQFAVDKATVVRAACYDEATDRISETVTATFLVGYEKRTEYANMAVLSLTADPKALFDPQTGIYGNGAAYEAYLADGGMGEGEVLDSFVDDLGQTRHRYMASNAFCEGKEWERKACITYFDENHSHCFTQNVGIRIAGNSTRSAQQKSLNLFARDIYGEGTKIPYDFFGRKEAYSSVKIRNGGGNMAGIKFLDAFLEEAARERESVCVQGTKPCAVFLNGEYWGLYNIRERYNAEYLAARFGVDPDGVMLVKAGNAVTLPQETMEAYNYMLDVVTQCDLSYEDTYALAQGLVDIQSLIDFCCIHLYLDNRDVALGYNTALWRTQQEGMAYGDGKWRFMLYDLDECAHPDSNLWEGRENWMAQHALFCEPVVQSLLDNGEFRRQFCISFMDIANTTFSYGRIHGLLEEWGQIYGAQTVKDHRRFFDAGYGPKDFAADMDRLDAFFKQRFSFAMESLSQTFGLSGELVRVSVHVNLPEAGTVFLNTARLENCSAWEGMYYSDFPVALSVRANEGYRFVGWEGEGAPAQEAGILSLENGDVALTAVFEKK